MIPTLASPLCCTAKRLPVALLEGGPGETERGRRERGRLMMEREGKEGYGRGGRGEGVIVKCMPTHCGIIHSDLLMN